MLETNVPRRQVDTLHNTQDIGNLIWSGAALETKKHPSIKGIKLCPGVSITSKVL